MPKDSSFELWLSQGIDVYGVSVASRVLSSRSRTESFMPLNQEKEDSTKPMKLQLLPRAVVVALLRICVASMTYEAWRAPQSSTQHAKVNPSFALFHSGGREPVLN